MNIPPENLYVCKEERELLQEQKSPQRNRYSAITPMRRVLIIGLMLVSFVHLWSCPGPHMLFPDTWKCKCGYENYEGITKCPICGNTRSRR